MSLTSHYSLRCTLIRLHAMTDSNGCCPVPSSRPSCVVPCPLVASLSSSSSSSTAFGELTNVFADIVHEQCFPGEDRSITSLGIFCCTSSYCWWCVQTFLFCILTFPFVLGTVAGGGDHSSPQVSITSFPPSLPPSLPPSHPLLLILPLLSLISRHVFFLSRLRSPLFWFLLHPLLCIQNYYYWWTVIPPVLWLYIHHGVPLLDTDR